MKTQLKKPNQENLIEANLHHTETISLHLWLKQLLFIFSLTMISSVNLVFGQVSAQLYTISGMVSDSTSGKGIPYVTIGISNSEKFSKKISSDENGKFGISLNSTGMYDLTFHSIGFRETKKAITIEDSRPAINLGAVTLIPADVKLGEVTVTALKPLLRSEAEKLVYNVESDPESTTSNALDMLRKVPLVSVGGEGKVQMRGVSGVKFMINGRTSSMLDQNPKEVLQSMPSNTIKDIEVITNPSSKYEAEGNAGIINIVTTRRISDGYNGNFNAGINSRKGYNGSFYFASKVQKLIYSINLSMNHWNNENMYNESTRETYVSTSNRYSEKKWFGDGSTNWNTINTEASYEINTLNLISLSLVGSLGDNETYGHTEILDYDLNHFPSMGFQNWFNSGANSGFLSANIDYQRLFRKEGNILTVSYRYELSPGDQWSDNNVLEVLNFNSYHQKISTDRKNNEGTLQIDYVNKINKKNQIETGYKQIWRISNATSDYLIFDQEQNSWVQDNTRVNDLDYTQSVLGLYFIYDLKIKKMEFKAGLRGESTVNHGIFKSTSDTTFTKRLFNLVPYLLFSSNFEKGNSFKFSYTQRLARPSIWLLNPFRNDADPQNIRTGNPNLETEVSHNIDASFNHFSKKYNYSVNLNGAFSGNRIVSIATILPNGVRTFTFDNIGDDRSVGISIYGSSQISKKLNFNTTFGTKYKYIRSNNNDDHAYSGWNYNAKIDFTFKPGSNTTLLAGAGAESGSIYYQTKSKAYWWSYVTCQQDLFEKKLKLELRLDSPFEKYQFVRSISFNKDFLDNYIYRNPSRLLSFKVSYKFGQMKDKVKKAKKSILNDDLKQ